MSDRYSVRSIVRTYELPPGVEKVITHRATTRFRENHITSFDEQYEHVAELVDQYTKPRLPKAFFAVKHPTRTSALYNGPGIEDDGQHKGHQAREAREIVQLLARERDTVQFQFVEGLIERADRLPPAAEVCDNLSEARSNLQELTSEYAINGKIRIPPRPIDTVRFKPLRITFKRRSFQGRPLEFFREHRDVYQDLTRAELFRFDPALYLTLRNANELHLAIPEAYGRYRKRKRAAKESA